MENQIRPIALGRSNWLFAGSLRAGQRAAAVMSLIQSAKLNGLDPYQYLRDVLQRLPTQKVRLVGELLPHRCGSRQRRTECLGMKNIEALIADGGEITIGAIYPIERAATAADGHNSVAMLVRREGETTRSMAFDAVHASR